MTKLMEPMAETGRAAPDPNTHLGGQDQDKTLACFFRLFLYLKVVMMGELLRLVILSQRFPPLLSLAIAALGD